MMRCGLYTYREEQNSTPLAANAFDEDAVAAKRVRAHSRDRAVHNVSAAVCYFWAPRLLLAFRKKNPHRKWKMVCQS